MDCVKNLTSCAGCTRKHTRCHWRDVSREELGALDHLMDAAYSNDSLNNIDGSGRLNGYTNGGSDHGEHHDDSDDDDSNPLEDLEALGEKEERENEAKAEREREDEEGLLKAKELSRQGWEESLKSHRQSHEEASSIEDVVEKLNDNAPTLDATANNHVDHRDEDVRMSEDVSKGDAETIYVAPSYGGFRAVNGPSTAVS